MGTGEVGRLWAGGVAIGMVLPPADASPSKKGRLRISGPHGALRLSLLRTPHHRTPTVRPCHDDRLHEGVDDGPPVVEVEGREGVRDRRDGPRGVEPIALVYDDPAGRGLRRAGGLGVARQEEAEGAS